jgi:hypothetical protein
MAPRNTTRAAKGPAFRCHVCGRPMAENRNRRNKLVPCNTPECVDLQNKRKAVYRANVGLAEVERPEPSEQSQRGGQVFTPDSIDTASGLAETPAGDEDAQVEPETIIAKDDHSEESIKKRLALKKELERGKVWRSPSLEQPIVVAPIGPLDAPFGYDENDNPIRPPLMGHTGVTPVVDPPKPKPISLYSPKPENPPPAPETVWNVAQYRETPAGRHIRTHEELRPGEKPISVSASSGQDLVKKIESRGIKPFGLDIKHGNRPPRAPREYSYRKIFELKRSQIVGWLSDLHIRYINAPTVVTVCRTKLVTQEAGNAEFEEWRAAKINRLKDEIADVEKDLEDLRTRWKINGHPNKTNIAMRNRFVKTIDGFKDEITQTKRAKPPQNESNQIEVDIPGTEHEELRFTGQQLDENWVKDYLKTYDGDGFPLIPEVDEETFRVFENAVITQAHHKKVYEVAAPDVLEKLRRTHPGLLEPGKDEVLDHGEHETRAEYETHTESDAHASGLRFRGKGIKVTGNKYYGKALETFDGVFKVNRGPGSGGDGGHPGAPDFDPSDDTND